MLAEETLVEILEDEIFVEETLVEATTLDELLLDASDESMYSSKRFPAPQYSYSFPGHMKLQSVVAA